MFDVLRGAVRPDDGAVLVNEREVAGDPLGARRQVAYVSGSGALYDDLSLRRNVQFFVRAAGRRVEAGALDNALRQMGVPERAFDLPARDLSPAWQFGAALAIAMLRRVSGLVLDEPAVGPDATSPQDLEESLDEFRRAHVSVLLTTSDPSLAAAVADRVGILRKGRLVTECTPERLLEWSLPDFLLEFTGTQSTQTVPPFVDHG